jgi:hypothetical protein
MCKKNIIKKIVLMFLVIVANSAIVYSQSQSLGDSIKKLLVNKNWNCTDIIIPDSVKSKIPAKDFEFTQMALKSMTYSFSADSSFLMKSLMFEQKGKYLISSDGKQIALKSDMGEQKNQIQFFNNDEFVLIIDNMPVENGKFTTVKLKFKKQ